MYLKCFGVVLPAVVWFVATATDPAEADHLPIQFIVSQVGNKQCIKITFEGGGDGHGIPATAGATFSANALTIIDSDAGGTGLFANEPVPSTTAFWPSGDSSVDVTFSHPVSDVSLFYSSAKSVKLEAFDATSTLVGTVAGPAQSGGMGCTGDPTGGFCNWTLLSVNLVQNLITSIRFSGPANLAGIDDLTFCTIGIPVDLDIKPGNNPNAVNPTAKGVIPVAILGSATFNVRDADVTTLEFGADGATPTHDLNDPDVYADHLQDVNNDTIEDLVSHYRTQDTEIQCGDTFATLDGKTNGGLDITGSDSIQTRGCS
jgi:hypothetical protein